MQEDSWTAWTEAWADWYYNNEYVEVTASSIVCVFFAASAFVERMISMGQGDPWVMWTEEVALVLPHRSIEGAQRYGSSAIALRRAARILTGKAALTQNGLTGNRTQSAK